MRCDLLDPERRLAGHRARRPAHLVAYEDAVGHVLGRLLRGEPVLRGVVAGAPSELWLDVDDDVRAAWSRFRREPTSADDPQTGSVDVQAIALPRTLREDPHWTMHQHLDREVDSARELLETEVRAALARRAHPSAGGGSR
ncbi:MAG: hypothetical protein MSC31_18695 [Solirubrobacteraceae bacterium MAG38_C4-C5]|nr:hypothetical protein [Candidatus Siliceabacter maunaloa]